MAADLSDIGPLAAFAYLIGSIPSGILLAKFFKLNDPRNFGSGNIGASNMTRLGGKKLGALTLACDVTKGALPCLLAMLYPLETQWVALIGFLTIFGHCYSIYLFFSGGKGVATTAGVLAVLFPIALCFALIGWIVTFAVTRVTSASAMIAIIFSAVSLVVFHAPSSVTFACIGIFLLVIRRHKKNLEDLLESKERSFR